MYIVLNEGQFAEGGVTEPAGRDSVDIAPAVAAGPDMQVLYVKYSVIDYLLLTVFFLY